MGGRIAIACVAFALLAVVAITAASDLAAGTGDCQRYADLAEKSLSGVIGHFERAQVWATLYVGCRIGGR